MRDELKDIDPNLKRIYAEGCPFPSDIIVDETLHLRRFNTHMAWLVIVILFVVALLSISLSVVVLRPPTTLTFVSDNKGSVVQMEPVEQPYSPARVNGFAADSVKQALHISFTDYQDHFLALSELFTEAGFDSYQKALIDNGWMDKIRDDGLTMWSEIRQAPKLTASGNVNGVFTYELNFAVDLFLGGGGNIYKPTRMIVHLRVQRSDDNLKGLKIEQLYFKEAY